MMATIELTLHADREDYRRSFLLDGVEVVVRAYWLERCAAWYVDMLTPEERPLAIGVRLTPGAPLNVPRAGDGMPPGSFFCTGPDSYTFLDLGQQVGVSYIEAA